MTTGTIHLHYPCFDGLVSASIAADFVENAWDWTIAEYRSVNYDRRTQWLTTALPPRSIVVDFLYHPDATLWADHHATTFLDQEAFRDFEATRDRRIRIYDADSPSCAMLLWKHFSAGLSDARHYHELAYWADKIDSAEYDSVEEAVLAPHPSMAISLTLGIDADGTYRDLLLRSLRTSSFDEIASLPEVHVRIEQMRARIRAGISRVRDTIRLEPGAIAVFEAEQTEGETISRYAPYLFYPEARYSVALVYSGRDAKITAMRNPWLDFESIELGRLFEKYGGGGHRRVASAIIPPESKTRPRDLAARIADEIRAGDMTAQESAKKAS
jgi:hypothetical protein